ncbi:MAG: hypothetical protein KJ593_08515 [Candidatus Omnitrophica bacterium]|nr:hypothetical protein [Candidatus Omnitrophota bacterium]
MNAILKRYNISYMPNLDIPRFWKMFRRYNRAVIKEKRECERVGIG